MTPEQQRIKLAEWDGWRPGGAGKSWGEGQTFGIPPNGEDWHWQNTPDYLSDLNAVHGLVDPLKLDQFQWVHYPRILFEVVSGIKWDGNMGYFLPNFTNATAAQRCEALLKTLGLWEETK